MVERGVTDSFMLVFRMDRQVKRVITPIGAAQAEKVERDYQLPHIEFDCKAMWDTGSTGCCIDRRFAEDMGLKVYMETKLHGPLGDGVAPTYLLDIKFQDGMTVYDVPAAAVNAGGAFKMVIGMDIINRGDFRLRLFDGKTVMTFSLPREDTP